MTTEVWCRLCGDRPATVGDGRTGPPSSCATCAAAADAAMEVDRLYFEAHPDETLYYREPLPGEQFGVLAQPEGIDESRVCRMVQVRKLGPGVRTRELLWIVT